MIRNNIEAGIRLAAIARMGKLPIRLSGGKLVVQQGNKIPISAPFYVNQQVGGRTVFFR